VNNQVFFVLKMDRQNNHCCFIMAYLSNLMWALVIIFGMVVAWLLYYQQTKSFSDKLKDFQSTFGIPLLQVNISQHSIPTAFAFGSGVPFKVWDTVVTQQLTSSSLFRIASVSKTLTALGIFHLVGDGKLTLDAPFMSFLSTLLPKPVDDRINYITIEDLLRHSGGWDASDGLILTPQTKDLFPAKSNTGKINNFDPQYDAIRFIHENTPLAIIEFMMQFPLNFEPGSKYAYSNLGYNILGRVIEVVSGQTYETFMLKNIFAKVGVTNAFIGNENIDQTHPNEVSYFDGAKDMEFVGDQTIRYKTPASYGSYQLHLMDAHGGWVMTGEDLRKIGDGMVNGAFFGKEMLDKILTPPAYDKGKNEFYSLGMRVRHTTNDVTLMHTGALTYGTFSMLHVSLKGKRVFAALCNHLDNDIGAQQTALRNIAEGF